MTFGWRRRVQAEACRSARQVRMSLGSATRMKPSMRPPSTSSFAASVPCAPPESSAPFRYRNGLTQPPTPFRTHTFGTPCFIGIPSACGYVPKKESNERFSSMITITCLILWMPCRALGAAARGDTEPQPTAAPTASTTAAELSALAERRVEWEDDWGTGPLIEVEVGFEVAEDLLVLADVGPGVRSPVGARVDPPAVQEVVLDELEV